jgi:XTP/dITP diphosphohydrolase
MKSAILLASNNAHKLNEIQSITGQWLESKGFYWVPQGELSIPEAPEPFNSFVENALTKARHAAKLSGLSAMADDSGLVVPALSGEPGVHSAVYAGLPRDDKKNNQKLLEAMAGKTNRAAAFVCCLVWVRWETDPLPLIACASWWGEIAQQPTGEFGFGYDPLFFLPEHGKTAAQLQPEEKNKYSHRAKALQRLLRALEEDPQWLLNG